MTLILYFFSKCYFYSKNNTFLKNHVGSRELYEIKNKSFRSFYTAKVILAVCYLLTSDSV